jgi:hypothetical protein
VKYQIHTHGWPVGQWFIPVGTIIDDITSLEPTNGANSSAPSEQCRHQTLSHSTDRHSRRLRRFMEPIR